MIRLFSRYGECAHEKCAWYEYKSDRGCCGMLPDQTATTDAALRKHLLWLDGRITDLEGERKELEEKTCTVGDLVPNYETVHYSVCNKCGFNRITDDAEFCGGCGRMIIEHRPTSREIVEAGLRFVAGDK